MYFVWFLLLSQVISLLLLVVQAHPGAVAQGRATCGMEYSTAAKPFEIPDIQEAWYLRRISTCESPVFWTSFKVQEPNQPLYIAAMAPELDRFRDQLQFHGILYGPGIVGEDESNNGYFAIPDSSLLPPEITVEQDLLGGDVGVGAAYLKPPENLSSCSFVDTNPVMKDHSDVIGGRCMEQFTFDVGYKNTLVQGATVFNWWLYSFEHRAVEPGTYYLQTWLTSRDDEDNSTQIIIPGKYEMTLGPWIWYRYATQETLQKAHSQGTACSCAYNELDYRERFLNRLGGVDSQLFESQLPGGTCSDGTTTTTSMCYTIDQKAYRSDGSAIEWSGIWSSLQANTTYEWSFFAYYQGITSGGSYDYPDPGMLVYVMELSSSDNNIESVATKADDAIKAAVAMMEQDNNNITTRVHGDTLAIEKDEIQYILFAKNTSITTNTTVLLQPTRDVSIAVFTQHVPSEFMAHVLKNADTGEYIFPTNMTLYSDNVVVVEDNGGGGGDNGNNNTSNDGNGKSGASRTITSITMMGGIGRLPITMTAILLGLFMVQW